MSNQRRNTLPRLSSPLGIEARISRRLAAFAALRPVGKAGTKGFKKPGSRNPRKVGR